MCLRVFPQLPSPDNWLCSGHLHCYRAFGLPYCSVSFPTSQLSSLAWTLSLVSPCDLDSRVSIMLLRDQDMSLA